VLQRAAKSLAWLAGIRRPGETLAAIAKSYGVDLSMISRL
jgi:hypothetical protein